MMQAGIPLFQASLRCKSIERCLLSGHSLLHTHLYNSLAANYILSPQKQLVFMKELPACAYLHGLKLKEL